MPLVPLIYKFIGSEIIKMDFHLFNFTIQLNSVVRSLFQIESFNSLSTLEALDYRESVSAF